MFVRRLSARPLAVLGAALTITLLATGAASAGFLDSLFPGNPRPAPTPAALPYAATPTPVTGSLTQPGGITLPGAPNLGAGYGTISGYGTIPGYGTTFCVRLCDGRF